MHNPYFEDYSSSRLYLANNFLPLLVGVIRALFEPYLLQSLQAGLPAWVEATNAHARDVYAHFGFKVVEEVIIGEGSIDANGNFVSGGKGVVTYGMLAEP